MVHGQVFTTQFRGLGYTHAVGTQVGAYDARGSRIPPRHVSDWRFVDLSTEGEQHAIGGFYPTREALLADVATFASERGFERF